MTRQRVSHALDLLPLEYVFDEVVRRIAGTGDGALHVRFRDGFVTGHQVVYSKPSAADLRRIGVAYRARLRDRETETRGG